MNYERHRRELERLYDDKASISRYIEVEKPSGETILELSVIYTDQPCRLSQKALGSNGQTDAENNIAYETKLFISPDLILKQGDEVDVIRQGKTLHYALGEPFLYPTHQEISLQRKDYA